jgi:hypothetical protein
VGETGSIVKAVARPEKRCNQLVHRHDDNRLACSDGASMAVRLVQPGTSSIRDVIIRHGSRRRRRAWNSCNCWKPAEEARKSGPSNRSVASWPVSRVDVINDVLRVRASLPLLLVRLLPARWCHWNCRLSSVPHSQANKEALDLCERLHLLIREAEQSLRTECRNPCVAQLGTRLPGSRGRQCEYTSTAAAELLPVYLHGCLFSVTLFRMLWRLVNLLLLWLRAKWALQGDGHVVAARWW